MTERKTDREEDFLRRWSRRKAEARQGPRKAEGEPAPMAEEPARPVVSQDSEPSQSGAPEKAADQPMDESAFDDVDFDKLDFQSDYTRFLKKGVPVAIQRRALRQLWRSDPVLACLDGLNDYDLDYTDAATVVKEVKTAWQMGRGFLTDEDLGIKTAAPEAGGAGEPQAPDDGKPIAGRAPQGVQAGEESGPGSQATAAPDPNDVSAETSADTHDKS